MPNKPVLAPSHVAINWNDTKTATVYGVKGIVVGVTCRHCAQVRYIPIKILKQQMRSINFTGACKQCWSKLPKNRLMRTRRNPGGRSIGGNGYVVLGKNAIDDDDLDLFDIMRGAGDGRVRSAIRGGVFEHRWVMAKYLGRALSSAECVDHMDGNKQNNSVENLRIYVRGKQQPGSCPGHGTYYHEWQTALRRIAELEAPTTGRLG